MKDSFEHVFKMGVAAVAFSAVLGCLCSDGGRYDGAAVERQDAVLA